MKGFGIEIKNELLDPKHVEAMGQAVWLYMWLIDKITVITEDKMGIVLGGKPVKFEDVYEDLGISADTYTRWIDKLIEYPYIEITRTSYGIVFKVYKAHKRFRRNAESDRGRFRRSAEVDSAEVRNVIKTVSVDSNTNTVIPKGITGAKPSYGNEEVNRILEAMKHEFELPELDGSQAENRRYAYLAIKKARGVENVIKIIKLGASDEFYGDKLSSVKKLYYHMVEIVQKARGKKTTVLKL